MADNFYGGKKVLVTGGTGLIGRPLVEMLLGEGALVSVVSLDDASRCHPGAKFFREDIRYLDVCEEAVSGMEYVFHLAGVKGSPAMTRQKPASFFTNIMLVNTNMMEAARRQGISRYLYCSTIGVYAPARKMLYEDDVWHTFPSDNDRFAGWAKRMGELQAEACRLEYDWDKVTIVRPANTYGPFDNFDDRNAMVIPSLIKRALGGEDPLVVWGDGSVVRDFIHCRDVAHGMMVAMEKGLGQILNLGNGIGTSIHELVSVILECLPPGHKVEWDTTKPQGDPIRVLNTLRARALGWKPEISLREGIKETVEWYKANREIVDKRFNIFDF